MATTLFEIMMAPKVWAFLIYGADVTVHRFGLYLLILAVPMWPLAAAGGGATGTGAGAGAGVSSPSNAAASPPAVSISNSTSPTTAASTGGASTAAGPTNSSVFFKMSRSTIYVLVYASDPITTTYISYEVASTLSPVMGYGDGSKMQKTWLVPEPAWALSDYATQCQNDPVNTNGAIVIYDVENDAGSFNFVILQETYAHLYAKAFFVGCEHYALPFQDDTSTGISSYSQTVTSNVTPKTGLSGVSLSSPPPTSLTSNNQTVFDKKITTVPTASPSVGGAKSPESQSSDLAQAERTQSSGTGPNRVVEYQWTKSTVAASPPEQTFVGTASKTIIPTMEVLWLSDALESRHFAANQYGVPLLTVAAAGVYLASRTYSETTSIQQTVPVLAGGSVQTTTQKQGNNSALPYGFALAGSSLQSLSGLTLGGANQSRVLKSAASSVASELRKQIRETCKTARPASSNTTDPRDPDQKFCINFDSVKL